MKQVQVKWPQLKANSSKIIGLKTGYMNDRISSPPFLWNLFSPFLCTNFPHLTKKRTIPMASAVREQMFLFQLRSWHYQVTRIGSGRLSPALFWLGWPESSEGFYVTVFLGSEIWLTFETSSHLRETRCWGSWLLHFWRQKHVVKWNDSSLDFWMNIFFVAVFINCEESSGMAGWVIMGRPWHVALPWDMGCSGSLCRVFSWWCTWGWKFEVCHGMQMEIIQHSHPMRLWESCTIIDIIRSSVQNIYTMII